MVAAGTDAEHQILVQSSTKFLTLYKFIWPISGYILKKLEKILSKVIVLVMDNLRQKWLNRINNIEKDYPKIIFDCNTQIQLTVM